MPWLVASLGTALKVLAVYAVSRILLALGLSYLIIEGIGDLKTFFENEIISTMGQLPQTVYDFAVLCGIDTAIVIIMSCIGVRLVMNGLVNGVIGTLAFRGIQGQVI